MIEDSMDFPEEKYLSQEYLRSNPTWDYEDGPWKAAFVVEILKYFRLFPQSICDVGCGSGTVLAALRHYYPESSLFGYDIAPAAQKFWSDYEKIDIHCQVGDFSKINDKHYDVLLLLDVIEHVANPFSFLIGLRGVANHFIFHIPLDLSAINILRETPILRQRNHAGHIQYYTKSIALSLLRECGYEIIHWRYSGAAFNSPHRTPKTLIASIMRRLLYFVSKDFGVRALGGETIFVLARNRMRQ